MLNNSLDFLNQGQSWPPADKDTRDRLEQFEQNAALFRSDHQEVFTEWPKLVRDDIKATLEIILNWPKRLSTLWADLLLGEPPSITTEDKDGQEFIDRLNQDNRLVETAYEVVLDVSRFGVGLFKARRKDGKAIVEGVYPGIWFPVVSRDNIRDFQFHVLAWKFKQNEREFLRVEIHDRGKIEHRVYRIEGSSIQDEVDIKEFYQNLTHIQTTGVEDDFLIQPVYNLRTTEMLIGLDDYRDLDSIIQERAMRFAQIARILDKHAAPNMYGPPDAMELNPKTGEYEFRKTEQGDYFPVGSEEQPPGYVTWEGQLEAAYKELETLLEEFYVLSETSAAAFGQLKSGLAESGSALRRLMMAPIAKTNRIRLRLDPALKRIIRIAAKLEGIDIKDIKIEWKDGLPEDDQERATIDTTEYTGGITSLERILHRRGLRGKELEEEIKKIKEEMGKWGMSPPNDPNNRKHRVSLPLRGGDQ